MPGVGREGATGRKGGCHGYEVRVSGVGREGASKKTNYVQIRALGSLARHVIRAHTSLTYAKLTHCQPEGGVGVGVSGRGVKEEKKRGVWLGEERDCWGGKNTSLIGDVYFFFLSHPQ